MMLEEYFKEAGKGIVTDLQQSLKRRRVNASGRLSRSIREEVKGDRLTISAAGYVFATEDGRKPTKKAGDGVLKKKIEGWLEDKGIPIWEGYTRKSQAYVIARKIHKDGTRLFRRGGNSGVISDVINERLLDEIAADVLREVEIKFLSGLAQFSGNGISSI